MAFKAAEVIEAVADAALRELANSVTPPCRLERDRRVLPIAADGVLRYDPAWASPGPPTDVDLMRGRVAAKLGPPLPAATLVPRVIPISAVEHRATPEELLQWMLLPGDAAARAVP
eukprot:gene1924-1264_t